MFLSLPQYEFPMPEGLNVPGGKHWRVVEMPLHSPWFLLTVERPDPSDLGWKPTHTLCIAWETDLADAIKAVEAKSVRGLVAMIPAWASPTGQWSSQEINEVWLHSDESGKFVSLRDAAGQTLDVGVPMPGAPSHHGAELLLRLGTPAAGLRPRVCAAGRDRPGAAPRGRNKRRRAGR